MVDPIAGLLTVTGDAWSNNITLSRDTTGNILVNGQAYFGAHVGITHDIRVFGLGGDDTINISGVYGYTGSSILSGGEGHDTLVGGPGDDALYGHTGNDTLKYGAGNDTFDGGAGNSRLQRQHTDAIGADRPRAVKGDEVLKREAGPAAAGDARGAVVQRNGDGFRQGQVARRALQMIDGGRHTGRHGAGRLGEGPGVGNRRLEIAAVRQLRHGQPRGLEAAAEQGQQHGQANRRGASTHESFPAPVVEAINAPALTGQAQVNVALAETTRISQPVERQPRSPTAE